MPRQEEINNVSILEPFDRYRYFIKKIADFDEMWLLKDDFGSFALSKIEDNIVLPFWSAEEFILSCLNGEWESYIPVKFSIDEFETVLLPLINEKNYLLDVFPVNNKSGFIVTIDEFIRDLNNELSNYG